MMTFYTRDGVRNRWLQTVAFKFIDSVNDNSQKWVSMRGILPVILTIESKVPNVRGPKLVKSCLTMRTLFFLLLRIRRENQRVGT